MSIGIVVALPEELSTLSSVKLNRGDVLPLHPSILVCLSGAGHSNAAKAAQKLVEQGANKLISWGCAAALAPDLKSGDLLITSTIIANGQLIETADNWASEVLSKSTFREFASVASLASNYGLISDSNEKQRLYTETAAAALDMESAAVASVAADLQLPFVTVRAIADTAEMNLPPAILKALNSDGEVVTRILIKHLLSHFWEIPALIKLGLHFNAAQNTLRKIARQLEQFH